jgi:hypothetical protein
MLRLARFDQDPQVVAVPGRRADEQKRLHRHSLGTSVLVASRWHEPVRSIESETQMASASSTRRNYHSYFRAKLAQEDLIENAAIPLHDRPGDAVLRVRPGDDRGTTGDVAGSSQPFSLTVASGRGPMQRWPFALRSDPLWPSPKE